jgi:hypothetical protein
VLEPLPVEPPRSLPVVPRQISCTTDHQLNRERERVRAQVRVTLPQTLHDPARAAVEFNVPRRGQARMVAEFNVPRLDPDKMAAEYNVPRLGQARMAVESNVPRLDRDKMAAESNGLLHDQVKTAVEFSDLRRDRAKTVAEFNVQYDPTTVADFQIVGRAGPGREAAVRSGSQAIGPIIGPTTSTIGISGTIGARIITSRSTTTGATIGPTTTTGLITIGGTITITRTSIGIPASIGGLGELSPR